MKRPNGETKYEIGCIIADKDVNVNIWNDHRIVVWKPNFSLKLRENNSQK